MTTRRSASQTTSGGAALAALALALAACGGGGSAAPDAGAAAPDAGVGPCGAGFNLTLEGELFYLPLAGLPRTTVQVGGVATEAVALTELVPDSVLAQIDYGKTFSPVELRQLYDYRLWPGQSGDAGAIVIDQDALTSGAVIVDGLTTALTAPSAAGLGVAGLCRVAALRRLVVTRTDATGAAREAVVHVDDLPTEAYVTVKGAPTTAVSFQSVLDAAALLTAGETPASFDYRLVPADMLGDSADAVRFPWGHGHLEKLRWVPSIRRTESLDRTGDLQDATGATPYGGVAASGWSTVKVLLIVALEPSPDPLHTVTSSAGAYTDPTSCAGCHEEAGRVDIPVTCTQCH